MKLSRILLYSVLVIAALAFIYPFYWMLLASFTPEANITKLGILPHGFTLDNYLALFEKIPIWRSFFNSSLVHAFPWLYCIYNTQSNNNGY